MGDTFWNGKQGAHKNTFDSIKAFSETYFRNDLHGLTDIHKDKVNEELLAFIKD